MMLYRFIELQFTEPTLFVTDNQWLQMWDGRLIDSVIFMEWWDTMLCDINIAHAEGSFQHPDELHGEFLLLFMARCDFNG